MMNIDKEDSLYTQFGIDKFPQVRLCYNEISFTKLYSDFRKYYFTLIVSSKQFYSIVEKQSNIFTEDDKYCYTGLV